jgi:hypothetical protein
MKKLFLTLAGFLAFVSLAPAQNSVLYQEDFGTTNGGTTLDAVGWSQILLTAGYSGIYSQGGAVDADTAQLLPTSTMFFGGNAGSGVFFTTNGAGPGTGGDSAFTSIDPTLYTNLNISVESQWSFQGGNLNCWFAVQVGGAWYVDTNAPLTTLQHSAGATFYQSSIKYNPAATNWNVLTNDTVVGIGPQAGANLSGPITGVGIVAALSGSGSWNYNNFLVTSISNTVTLPPALTAAPITQENYAGAGVSFAVNASGTQPFTYVWEKDGVILTNNTRISGATNSIITIRNISAADVGTYSVIVSNSAGGFDTSTNNTPATLIVDTLPSDYLYAETFPFVGASFVNYPVSVVGWTNNIPDGPNRIFSNGGGNGVFFAFEGFAATTAFLTTTNTDTGASGLPFPKITPSAYPAIAFSADIAPSFQPANVTAYFAVRMSSGSWYVSSTPIPVNNGTATSAFTTYAQQFSPLAANWDNLTLSATGATIGSVAASDLTGDITGAGMVFVHTGSGTFNVDNFLVTTDSVAATPPTITISPLSQTVFAGAGVSFAGAASGAQPLTYYWQKDGVTLTNNATISGANSNIITLRNVDSTSAGQYSLIASNSAGQDTSANYITTILTVNDRPANLLYNESFPWVGPTAGNYPASVVGWNSAIPDSPARLFQNGGGDGAMFSFEGSASVVAFCATATSDNGASGLPFPSMAIAGSSGLTFSVDIAPSFAPANVSAALAVQINGGSWYISATNLPVDTSTATGTYTTQSQVFSPAAANWKNLTISGTGATVGSAAGADLSGNITGAGVVFTHTGSGTFNFDNFQVTGSVVPNAGTIAVGHLVGNTLTLTWPISSNVRLQTTTNLHPPVVWSDVPNTLGQGSATVTNNLPAAFYRLFGN